MKIVSFNINGIRARLHQLQALIDSHQPDIIGLQETKVHDEAFPVADVEAMGYQVHFHGGKAHYGVAMLSKKAPIKVIKGFASDAEDAQRRLIIGQFEQDNGRVLTVINGYFPQGDNISHETKYPAKRKFYQDLMTHLQTNHQADEDIAIIGDINISPVDLDIGIGEPNAKRWLKTGKCSFQPEERQWLATLLDWGFVDSFRHLHPQRTERYSWFDYRSKGFVDNRGLRIDVVLVTKSMVPSLVESDVDYDLRGIEKPSDHAPIWSTFN
ncbi:exodeoxyribonuclease III [Shewanella intestini]|uniref:Exodeoxyribonuclease III n=1 Tax=Shewanella intestini TaxID=2017544 RepID=A0ABS5I0L2_9GAMM|nr:MULTISPECIES: exodeoxyribonuclease III [Shewanella]MBR9726925.1 exodeoxyribonuclease III [Shewanella intestini]MRG34509.1 exodeoxyribonuclease III [Shewanella sp. XMDDZSB0408]